MKLRTLFSATVACLAMVGIATAQDSVLTLIEEPAAEVETQTVVETATPAMWRVADADSEYILLGTFHILPAGIDWRTDALNQAFKDATTVYFEVDADSPAATSTTLNVVMTQGFNPPGTTLSQMLDADDVIKLREVVASLGLPFAAIDPMRPWNAFLSLSVQFIINQGFDPGAGVDSVLLKESKTIGKDIRYFETLEEQLGFFTTLDAATEKKLLEITLRDWDNQKEAFDDLFVAWKSGDTSFVDEQMNDLMRVQAPTVFERLIVERNLVWANELDAALKNEAGQGFVAVGAAHLVGEEFSVPALLAAKGYEVSRFDIEAAIASDDDAVDAPEAATGDTETTTDAAAVIIEPVNDPANDNEAASGTVAVETVTQEVVQEPESTESQEENDANTAEPLRD